MHLRDQIDKQAARKAAQEYGLKASQRNRVTLKQRAAANSRSKRCTDHQSKPKKINKASFLQRESKAEEIETPNGGVGQKKGVQSCERIEQKQRRGRSMDLSRVLGWVQESSKLSTADGTLLAHPNDSSSEDNRSTKSSAKDFSHPSTVVIHHLSDKTRNRRPSFDVSVQTAKSETQSTSVDVGKHTATKKQSSRSGSRKASTSKIRDKSQDRLKQETEADASEDTSLEDSPDSIAIKQRIKDLQQTKDSLLAEKRVLSLRIEEVQLRREVRQLAREVAKARAELMSLSSHEQKEIQRISDKDSPANTKLEQLTISQRPEQETKESAELTRLLGGHPMELSIEQSLTQRRGIEELDRSLCGTILSPGVNETDCIFGESESRIHDKRGVNGVQIVESLSSNVETPFIQRPRVLSDNFTVENTSQFQTTTNEVTDLVKYQSTEKITNEEPTAVNIFPKPLEQGSVAAAGSSGSCERFPELDMCLEDSIAFVVEQSAQQTLNSVLETLPGSSLRQTAAAAGQDSFIQSGDVHHDTQKTWSYPFRDVSTYVQRSKDLKTAPAVLMHSSHAVEDHELFVKNSTHEGVEMLSAGEEEGDEELKVTFSGKHSIPSIHRYRTQLLCHQLLFTEEIERLAGHRLDLSRTEFCKEEKDDKTVSRSSGTISISLDDEVECAILPDCFIQKSPIIDKARSGNEDSEEEEDQLMEDGRFYEATQYDKVQTGRLQEQSNESSIPLDSIFEDLYPGNSPMESAGEDTGMESSPKVSFPELNETRKSPCSLGDIVHQRENEDVADIIGMRSSSDGLGQTKTVQTTLVMTSCSSPCLKGFSRTTVDYIEELIGHFVRAFADPIFPELLLENQLPLSLDVFHRIEEELGNSYMQEAFDRAVFDSVNKRIQEIYRYCGRLKTDHAVFLMENSWEIPAISYLMEDVQKSVLKTTDCDAIPFAPCTHKEAIIDEMLQLDAKRFGKQHVLFQNAFPASSEIRQTAF
eukprot:g2957.t1